MAHDTPIDNVVQLRGRLAGPPDVRELPSGDELVSFSLTVRRPAGERGTVDSIECTTGRARVRKSIEQAEAATWFAAEGSLRRRFWRSASGVQSRYAVDVRSIRRIDPPADA